MKENNHLEIYNSHKVIIKLIMSGFLFVVVGIVLILLGPEDGEMLIIGWLSIIFFGLGVIILIIRFFSFKPILIVNDFGITDNSTAIAAGFIPWSNVKSIDLIDVAGVAYISLDLYDKEGYLAKTSKFKQKVVEVNKELGFEVVLINLQTISEDPEEVFNRIIELANKYGKKDRI